MRYTRKVNIKLLEEVQSKESTRGDVKGFTSKFLLNFSESYYLYDYIIKNCKEDVIIQVALSQHIVSLISICETFFRDIFVFLTENDPCFADKIIADYNLRLNIPDTNNSVDIKRVLSEYFNFQQIEDLEYAFKPIITEANFFETIGNIIVPFYNHKDGDIRKFCMNVSLSNWKELFNEVLTERHNITHDANYNTKFKPVTFERHEKAVLYFPQVFSLWICSKYQLPIISLTIKDKGTIPYIFQIEDILSEWTIVDE